MPTGVCSSKVVWQVFFERYPRGLLETSSKFPIHFLKIYSPRRGRVCNGSGIVAMPQRAPDKPGVRFQIVEALLDIHNTFEQPIHLVAGRQIQSPEGRVRLWLHRLGQAVLPPELLLKKFALHGGENARTH